LVEGDIRKKIKSINREKVDNFLKEIFGVKDFVCPDLPK